MSITTQTGNSPNIYPQGNKLILVYLYNELPLSNKKEQITDKHNNMMNFKNITLGKSGQGKRVHTI